MGKPVGPGNHKAGNPSCRYHSLEGIDMELNIGKGGVERAYSHMGLTVFASDTRDTTHSSRDVDNINHLGVQLVVDVTDETAGGSSHSMVVKIQGKDPASGKYYDLLASAAITATGTTLLTVHPAVTPAANLAAAHVLPRSWRVTVEHTADGGSDMTYSIGANLVM